ncbi:MAG: outer membrane lipoprotein carrier protein LolA [Bacteroidetes bacterium]|nr:MAG: outer membrane lipoprotein carrier protein LolA [Bacteroidota bacterium]
MYQYLLRTLPRTVVYACLCICLTAVASLASPLLPPKRPPNDIDRIIQEARTKQDQIKDFAADFTYQLSYPGEQHPVLKGSLIYSDGMYVVSLPDPRVYCDGNVRWYYFSELKEVVIKEYEPEVGIAMPFQVFRKGREPRYEGRERINGKLCDVLLFRSMAGSSYQKAKVWVDAENRLVLKIILLFENQGAYTFTFSNIRINQGFKEADFQFPMAKYPGVSVIDERIQR